MRKTDFKNQSDIEALSVLIFFCIFNICQACAQPQRNNEKGILYDHWVRITNHPADDFHGAFSPDGKEIVFDSRREGHYEIYKVNADGTDLRRITTNVKESDHLR